MAALPKSVEKLGKGAATPLAIPAARTQQGLQSTGAVLGDITDGNLVGVCQTRSEVGAHVADISHVENETAKLPLHVQGVVIDNTRKPGRSWCPAGSGEVIKGGADEGRRRETG